MIARAAPALFVIAACAPREDIDRAAPPFGGAAGRARVEAVERYLGDSAFRRSELAGSLVEPTNTYSRVRLERYATWEQLPEWNPRTSGRDNELAALAITPAAAAGDRDALVDLGARAFARYPVQLVGGLADLPDARDDRYGLWRDGDRVGGLVRVELPGGARGIAYTCATCHATVRDGRVIAGLAADALDIGRLLADTGHATDPALLAWGRGRADVSTARGDQPVRIPDLRPTRYLTHLQVNATVEQRNLASLALRIETLIVTAHGEVVRPPRAIAAGLALYLWSLAPDGPARPATSLAEQRGGAVFDATCAGCHAPPGFTGPPVAIDRIGVDAIASSRARGTGTWRVPSLLGVHDRRALFHDGALADVAAVLDPRRLAPDYTRGRRPGPVDEHRFGLELDAGARADLVAYLATL